MCFLVLPWLQGPLSKMAAQESVGTAIRICKAIGKPEYADQFNEMVKGHFVPDEHQKELFFFFKCEGMRPLGRTKVINYFRKKWLTDR
jgi:hypothetical protein